MTATTVILDPGTHAWKCGPVGETRPAATVPAIIGTPSKTRNILRNQREADGETAAAGSNVQYGEDALRHASTHKLASCMARGAVTDWDAAEALFHHILHDELEIDIEGSGVLVAVPPFSSDQFKERMAALVMESFSMSRVALMSSSLMALYASARFTGMVLDVGSGLTSIMPLYDSVALVRAIDRLDFSGQDVDDHLRRLLYERGFSFSSVTDEWQVRLIKDKLSYVAEDYNKELQLDQESLKRAFELPDGQEVEVAHERFRCTEILFNPGIVHEEKPSVSAFVARAIKNCDIDLRKELSANIVLSGGTTKCPGFASRLKKEVANHFPGLFGHVDVVLPDEPQNAVWNGGSVIASIESFDDIWVSREVYQEHGPSIVQGYRKKSDDDEYQ